MRRRLKIIRPDLENSHAQHLPATGIFLAGGKNSRMRRNKAFLELEGKPLVARSLAILRSLFTEVLISSNEPALYEAYGVPVIPDQEQGKGPLAGLAAGLKAASFASAFFVACDMPFVQAGAIRYLWQWVPGHDVVVPRGYCGPHPLHAFYHKNCLPFIEENLKAGCYKIIDFYPSCRVHYVKEEELQTFGDVPKILSNVNTPGEWAAISGQED